MTKKITSHNILIHLFLPIVSIILGLFISDSQLINHFIRLNTTDTVLLNDSIGRHGVAASLLNAGLIGIINVSIFQILKLKISGLMIATFYTVFGFSFLGMTLTNLLPIYIGNYFFRQYHPNEGKETIFVCMLVGSLGPVVSHIMFGYTKPTLITISIGILMGILIGFIVVPFARQTIKVHHGFNLYNVGFVSGIFAIVYNGFTQGLGYPIKLVNYLADNTHWSIYILLIISICFFLFLSYTSHQTSLRVGLSQIYGRSGKMLLDYMSDTSESCTYLNMALVGVVSIIVPILFQIPINGLILSAIFCIIGFGAYGKNLKNILPILLGAFIASILSSKDLSTSLPISTILFSTTLAPISEIHGKWVGMFAGFCHVFVSSITAVFGAGLNLYNNGFAGGVVAIMIVVFVSAFKKEGVAN